MGSRPGGGCFASTTPPGGCNDVARKPRKTRWSVVVLRLLARRRLSRLSQSNHPSLAFMSATWLLRSADRHKSPVGIHPALATFLGAPIQVGCLGLKLQSVAKQPCYIFGSDKGCRQPSGPLAARHDAAVPEEVGSALDDDLAPASARHLNFEIEGSSFAERAKWKPPAWFNAARLRCTPRPCASCSVSRVERPNPLVSVRLLARVRLRTESKVATALTANDAACGRAAVHAFKAKTRPLCGCSHRGEPIDQSFLEVDLSLQLVGVTQQLGNIIGRNRTPPGWGIRAAICCVRCFRSPGRKKATIPAAKVAELL